MSIPSKAGIFGKVQMIYETSLVYTGNKLTPFLLIPFELTFCKRMEFLCSLPVMCMFV